MDIAFLAAHIDFLAEHMRNHGYSTAYIKTCRSTANHIIRLSEERSLTSYDDVRAWVSSCSIFSEQYRENVLVSVTVIENYDEKHLLPVHPIIAGQGGYRCHSAGSLDLLPFQERIGEFRDSLLARGFRLQYVKRIISAASRIIVTARIVPWDSFEEISDYYERTDHAEQTKQVYRLTIRKMASFWETGKVPRHRNDCLCAEDAKPSLGALDLYGLKERLPDIQEYMKEHQYSPGYIRRVMIRAENIIVQAGKVSWDSYQDVLDWYDSQGSTQGVLGEIHTIIRLISAFHLYGIYPNNRAVQHPIWHREKRYERLNPYFKEIVDYGCSAQENRGLRQSSVDRARCEATAFFYSMQEKGIPSIEEISEDDILSFFRTDLSSRHRTKIPGLSLFMRDCIPLSPVEFRRIDSLLPITHTFRKTIQYLKTEESKAIQNALEDYGNDLTLKQRAIGTIFFYNGMRSSDVANLKLDSIDLRRGRISFTQMKTDVQTVIPLMPVVGNAIYDYCTMERPKSESPYLFLGDRAPHNPMTSRSMWWVVEKIMNRANIRREKKDRRGTHIFRHRLAATMAENNIPTPVISATLGHTSPKSLDAYLSADIVHLRECALPLGKYEMEDEVFDIG